MDKRKLRAVVWAAVSSKPQLKTTTRDGEEEEKESLPEQIAEGRAYAERMGWQVVGELSVPGHSREYIHYRDAAQEIEAYAELERLAGERAFDVLITRGRDRLGRTDALISTAEAIVAQGGAQVLSLAMPHPISGQADRGLLYVSAIERASAQSELVEFRRRHASGMRRRTLQGRHPNKVPYPWRRGPDGEPFLPPDRLAVARMMMERYLDGEGFELIASALNSAHVPPPLTGAWQESVVSHTLFCPFNRGLVAYGLYTRQPSEVIWAPSRYPAIFSEEEAAALDAERARRRPLGRGISSPHIWTGIVKCLRCGHHMAYGSRQGVTCRIEYYYCNRHTRMIGIGLQSDCHRNQLPLWKIEDAAQAVLGHFADDAVLDAALAELAGGQRGDTERRLAEAEAAIERITGERERLTTAYLRSILSLDEYEARMEVLAADLQAHSQQARSLRQSLQALPDLAVRREELREVIPVAMQVLSEDAPPEEARRILRATFRAVWCENGQVVRVEMI